MTVTTAGVKLSGAVREKYLAAIMVQDQAFFDRIGAGEVVTRSSKDIDSIRIGLGERVGYLFWTLSAIICVSPLCPSKAYFGLPLTHRPLCPPSHTFQNSPACSLR